MSASSAPSAVVDTNLFVSGMITPGGRPSRLLDIWHAGWFELLLSDRQNIELTEVFRRPKIVRDYQLAPMRLIQLFAGLAAATLVIPSQSIPVSLRDPKDEHILAAAIGGNADYLVTGDQDLLVHRDDPRLGPLKIVTAAEFLNALEEPPFDTGEAS